MFFALKRRFLQCATSDSLSNCERSLSLMQLLVGSPALSYGVSWEMSVARNLSFPAKPYSCPHCLFSASAADIHIIPVISFATSVDNTVTGIP